MAEAGNKNHLLDKEYVCYVCTKYENHQWVEKLKYFLYVDLTVLGYSWECVS